MKSHWIPDVRPVDLRNDDWPDKSPASKLMRNPRRYGEYHMRNSHDIHGQAGCKNRSQ
jgi:hypothetical protein